MKTLCKRPLHTQSLCTEAAGMTFKVNFIRDDAV